MKKLFRPCASALIIILLMCLTFGCGKTDGGTSAPSVTNDPTAVSTTLPLGTALPTVGSSLGEGFRPIDKNRGELEKAGLSANYYMFSPDSIVDAVNYIEIISELSTLANGEFDVSGCSASVDFGTEPKALVSFTFNSSPCEIELDFDGSSFDYKLLTSINSLLPDSGRRFYYCEEAGKTAVIFADVVSAAKVGKIIDCIFA